MKIRPLSPALQEKANTELNENENRLEENLLQFKSWLDKQPHLKYKNDDQFLVGFLRGSKFSLERAKEKIDFYYTFRTMAPEFAQNRDPHSPPLRKCIEIGLCVPLVIPKENPTAPRVLLCSHRNYDPDELTLTIMMKNLYNVCDIMLNEDDNYAIAGVKMIWDMKGVKMKTALQCTPQLIKKIVLCCEKAFPTRSKGIYLVNVPKYFEPLVNIAKNLLSKKLAKRFFAYSTDNWDAVFKDIPKSIFPYEYGGGGGKFEDLQENWSKTLEKHRERLIDENNYYSDESKRLVKIENLSDIYGVEGSFKKLEID